MSRRASLPGAEELFRRTTSEGTKSTKKQDDSATNLQVAPPAPSEAPAPAAAPAAATTKAPRHDEKVTFYCKGEDLLALENARLALRSKHGLAADRGKIVRAALAYVLEDFEARGDDSVLLRKLHEG